MGATTIEWATDTWNLVAGCTRASTGCERCYAERQSQRLANMGQQDYAGVTEDWRWTGVVKELPHRLEQPLRWRKPRLVFVCSMADLFHPRVSNEFIAAVFGVMAQCPQHFFLLLTKRAERLPEWFAWSAQRPGDGVTEWMRCTGYAFLKACETFGIGDPRTARLGAAKPLDPDRPPWPLPNVGLGVTVENLHQIGRVADLLACPAALRYVSCEPLLGPIPLRDYLPGIDWVIAGGETGPRTRPMHLPWARQLRDQASSSDVPFLFKKRGNAPRGTKPGDTEIRELDGVVYDEFPALVERRLGLAEEGAES